MQHKTTSKASTRHLEFIKEDELDLRLNEIEHKDFYDLIDDIDTSPSTLKNCIMVNKIVYPTGVRTHIPCEGLAYTPYFFYETDEQKNEYKKFIELAISYKKKR